ncbi:hypothetical protein ACRW9N_13380 [Listeria aquatica]|uniref:hypothetical protein n=1 Tax=Listeria aquatica TaxID=1494960 RepID=UPI003EF5738E
MEHFTKEEQIERVHNYFMSTSEAVEVLKITRRSALTNLGDRGVVTQIKWDHGNLFFCEEIYARAALRKKEFYPKMDDATKEERLEFLHRYFVTRKEAILLLKTTGSRFNYLVRSGKVKGIKKGGATLYFRKEIDQFAERR